MTQWQTIPGSFETKSKSECWGRDVGADSMYFMGETGRSGSR